MKLLDKNAKEYKVLAWINLLAGFIFISFTGSMAYWLSLQTDDIGKLYLLVGMMFTFLIGLHYIGDAMHCENAYEIEKLKEKVKRRY